MNFSSPFIDGRQAIHVHVYMQFNSAILTGSVIIFKYQLLTCPGSDIRLMWYKFHRNKIDLCTKW